MSCYHLDAMGRQRAPRARKPKPKEDSSDQSGPVTHPRTPHRSSRSALIDLQRSVGNGVVSRLIQRIDPPSVVRDTLLEQSRALMEDGLAKVPTCLGLASQLQTEATQLVPGLPATMPSAQVLVSELTLAGTLLDSSIALYQQAGGNLTDIEGLLKVRAHLSTALFYTNVVLATPASGMHQQVLGHTLAAQQESIQFQVDEAVGTAESPDAVAGSMTEEETARQQARNMVLRGVYLGQFGLAPSIGT